MIDSKTLSIKEKIRFLTGKDAWCTCEIGEKVPEVRMADGPNGVRRKDPDAPPRFATSMPNGCVVANTWSVEVATLEGKTIAQECIENDVDVILGPGINIKRTPVCGRNFEYFSEDPYLAGVMAKAYVEGVQNEGVGACVKHYCANNRELPRCYQSSEVDERTLREIYTKPFEMANEASPWMVMCSYNPVNGVYASENKKILDGILRKQIGYNGVIVSDWAAVHSRHKAAKASLDLAMPFNQTHVDELTVAYEKGLITETDIDECVERLLALAEKKTQADKRKKITTTKEERHQNAVKIAKEGIVLLKNEDGVLPLKTGKTLVLGQQAIAPLIVGGGSGTVATEFVQTPLHEVLSTRMPDSQFSFRSVTRRNFMVMDAYEADTVVICVSAHLQSECMDRDDIRLPKSNEDLILRTAEVNENVIVVIYSGSAVDMSAWVDKVKGVVFCGYPGEGANEALADILSGKTVPSGKLAETFPLTFADTFGGGANGDYFTEWYNDGIFVGYRYYEQKGKDVLFPFGHGLSYAKFTYSDLRVKKLGETDYEISYSIRNESDVDAKEVSQVYVKDVFAMVVRPKKELKGFSKDLIKAHEEKRITIKLDASAFAYYSTSFDNWYVENGTFEILVGASSADIRLKEKIEIALPEEKQQSKI